MRKLVSLAVILFAVVFMNGCSIMSEKPVGVPSIGDRNRTTRYDVSLKDYRGILLQCLGATSKTFAYMALPIAVTTPDGRTFDLTGASDEDVYNELHRLDNAIYGLKDDRKDYYQVLNVAVQRNMDAVASLWRSYNVQRNLYGTMTVKTVRYGHAMGLCKSEPFWEQPIGAFCTGFLVADDIVITAGHCTNSGSLETCKIVFGYRMDTPTRVITTVPNNDVYGIKEIIARRQTSGGLDFAILRLDRKCDRPYLKLATEDVKKGDSVYIIGYPVGLPIKYADEARVLDVSDKYTFQATLDAYGGNSGSPVFNDKNEVVGILVRGMPDFVTVGNCKRSMMIPVDTEKYFGESVTKISQFKDLIPEE